MASEETDDAASREEAARVPDAVRQVQIDAAIRARIKDYFDEKYDSQVDRLRALRFTSRLRKIALGGFGILLASGGIAALSAGYVTRPWLRDWQPLEIAVIALGCVALLVSLFLIPVSDLHDPEQVEKDIDAAVKHDADSLLTSAVKLLNLSDGPTQTFDVTLVGYPDKEACARLGIPIGGRIGVDKRPRVTPVAVTAIKLWPSRLAIYKGTVSLITGEMVEERLLEVGYKDIVILERQSLARPQPANTARKEAREEKARKPARRRSLHEKDLLAIHFANQQSIEIVLRDSRFAAPLNAGELALTATHDEIKEFWNALRRNWHRAQGAVPSSEGALV